MSNVTWGLIGLSALAFVLAVAVALSGVLILGVTAEGFSRACNNLAVIAIALAIVGKGKFGAGGAS